MMNQNASSSRLKTQRASIKRKTTLCINALSALVEQRGSKTRIRQFMSQLDACIKDAERLNEEYISTLPEIEHEQAYEWYANEFRRINDILCEAASHLDLREESGSINSSVSGSSVNFNKNQSDVSIRAKAKAAEVFAKRQKEMEREKQKAIEDRILLHKELLKAQQNAASVELELEKHHIMSEEAAKTQQLEAEAARLGAKALAMEKRDDNLENLEYRLKDFDDFELNMTETFVPPPDAFRTVDGPSHVSPVHETNVGHSQGYVLTPPGAFVNNSDDKPVKAPLPLSRTVVDDTVRKSSKGKLPACHVLDVPSSTPLKDEVILKTPVKSKGNGSWITQLVDQEQDMAIKPEPIPYEQSVIRSSNSLPKLKLDTFDGDPLHWPDWMSMFQSIIHEANISSNAKMQHLQNSVSGRAKEAIEGYGYSGDSYVIALGKLESRFGKPEVVVKAHLNRLRRWNRLSDDRLQEVRHFSDAVSSAVNSFKRLGYVEDLHAATNLNMVVDKLPSSLAIKWKEHIRDRGLSRANLVDFCMWIDTQADIYDEFNLRPSRQQHVRAEATPRPKHSSNVAVSHPAVRPGNSDNSSARSNATCVMGDYGSHKLHSCRKFKELSVTDRLRKVKDNDLCFRCLGKHWAKDCNSTKQCGIDNCTRLHHELLHRKSLEDDRVNNTNSARGTTPQVSSVMHVGGNSRVLLQIVPVLVFGPGGKRKAYALLDMGSTCTLILNELASSLRLGGSATLLDLYGIQKTTRLEARRVTFSVGPDDGSGSKHVINNALSVNNLNLPPTNANLADVGRQWKHLEDLNLHDLDGAQIEIVLGSDVTELIVPREVREGPKGSPIAVKTKLGWTVTGSVPGYTRQSESVYFTHVSSPEEELNELVKLWWKTESFGCSHDYDLQRSREDDRAMRLLEDTTRKVDNRYEVGLLWKDENIVLPNNKQAAEKRLRSLERRLDNDTDLNTMYRRSIENDLEKGYVREVSGDELTKKATEQEWYLPHHPVTHPNKPGKVRRVCDAAASYKGTSLNDKLSAGPDLLNSLVGILMRFRQESVAISADIEAMFNQVAVPLNDQPALRFLWRDNPGDIIKVYQYQRHIFGAKSAPTCANYALRRTALDNILLFPEEAETVIRNFYMDDLFKSVATVNEAVRVQSRLVELLSLGGFHLTKWISNNKDVLKVIPDVERAQSVRTITDDSNLPVEKALGVVWDVQEDAFKFKSKPKGIADTRRKIVSIIASLFDPLGCLAPFVLKAKVFLQKLWQLRQGWDDPIPHDLQEEWSNWQRELENLEGFSLMRFYRNIDTQPTSIQLHVFGDASELAFCAVAYFRFEFPSGRRLCVFVCAKNRVAPIKPLSIPKLELQAAVLSARLSVTVKKEHDYTISSTHLWTDSSCVLGQIRGLTKRHPSFVANRLAEIHDLSDPSSWRHCPGKLNPADEGSRGMCASAIDSHCRWLNGPAFLLLSEDQWPEDIPTVTETSFTSKPIKRETNTPIFDLAKYSSAVKVFRVTAWVQRFIRNCRNQAHTHGPLTVAEIRAAKMYWIKCVQKEEFGPDINDLKSGRSLSSKSSLITLTPFLDDSQVLRVGGRIGQAEVDYNVKHPIVMPQGRLCSLFVMDTHLRLKHEGTEHVRNELRQVYWITHSRSTVRKILNSCPYCRRRRKAKPQPPMMSSLPRDRLTVAPPFTKVGVDYFGPLTVKHLRKQEKRYGCLFTCLVTRAVHLEVAVSLETDAFINALRRFTARRGTPTDIYSDNGTNFVGADRELKESLASLDQSKISDYLAQREVQWHFNPPASPHCGGVWERLVQSCKKALKVILHAIVVTDDVLHTAMAEAESLVNSRPLTEVSSDPDDLEAITPNHFLLSRANPVLPIGVFSDKELSSRKRWRQVQAIADQMWNRWMREYLPTLIERKKWFLPTREIKVGDLVLLVGEKTPRGDWPLARVVKIFPGKDNTKRVCEVKTKAGFLKRSLHKVALLEEP